jgi:phage tail-like protein
MAGRVDPYKGFRFLVEIDGIQQAAFTECSGLGSQIEVVEYRDGTEPNQMRKLPGKIIYPDIVLKWGVTDSRELYDWHLAVINGNLQRKNGSIILLDDQGNEKIRWNFEDAWPSRWEGPSLDARSCRVAIESLTLTCEKQVMA